MLKALRSGLLITVLMIGGLIYIAWLTTTLPQPPNKDVTKYLEQTIPLVVKSWNLKDLRNHAGDCLLKSLNEDSKENFKSLFAQSTNKLGALKYLEITKTTRNATFCTSNDCINSYKCLTPAVFEKGKATIETSVLLDHKNLSLQSFNIQFE